MPYNCRVLVIDDSPFIFMAVSKALVPNGFEMVGHAQNGKLGIEMYEQHKPDLVVMDITMPEMDGVEAATILFKKYPDIKVIMLSAIGEGDAIENLKKAGARHFLTKPFKPEVLLETIKEVFGE